MGYMEDLMMWETGEREGFIEMSSQGKRERGKEGKRERGVLE